MADQILVFEQKLERLTSMQKILQEQEIDIEGFPTLSQIQEQIKEANSQIAELRKITAEKGF
jgi:hypothetical protein